MTIAADLETRRAVTNGISMAYVEAGSGEPVVLLHGFPEFWYSWRHQIDALAPDYRVIVPDQRGYAETEARPPYDRDTLVADVAGLLDALGERSAHIVGHDWGGAVAWFFAMTHPERVRTLAICNSPHPLTFARALRSRRQARRSWYMGLFQIPWLPERMLASHNYHFLARRMIRDCAPGTFTKDDVRRYLEAWRQQGLAGGVNWYRAAFRRRSISEAEVRVESPTLVIWGARDRFLGIETLNGIGDFVPNLRVEYLPEAGHWVQQEAPERVNALLREHLRAAR